MVFGVGPEKSQQKHGASDSWRFRAGVVHSLRVNHTPLDGDGRGGVEKSLIIFGLTCYEGHQVIK